MALGALIDAGADLDEVRRLCDRLPVGGWELEAEAVMRTGIGGTKVHVHASTSTVVRTAAHITGMIEEARLPERMRQRALATFEVLARAEGHLHRRPPESVHFHEVGGIDAIIDVVGTCAALELLDIDEVDAERGGQRHRHGAQRARPAARPGPGRRRAAAGSSDVPARRPRGADHAHRRRPAGGHGDRVGADAGHDHRPLGLRGGLGRPGRAAQPDAGDHRRSGHGAHRGATGRPGRGERGRCHRRDAGSTRWPR